MGIFVGAVGLLCGAVFAACMVVLVCITGAFFILYPVPSIAVTFILVMMGIRKIADRRALKRAVERREADLAEHAFRMELLQLEQRRLYFMSPWERRNERLRNLPDALE